MGLFGGDLIAPAPAPGPARLCWWREGQGWQYSGGAPPALQDPRSVPHSGVFCGKRTELRLGPHFGVPFLARSRLGGGARGTLRAQERPRGSATAFTGLISAAGRTLAGIKALQNLPAGPWAGISSAVWLRAPLRMGGPGWQELCPQQDSLPESVPKQAASWCREPGDDCESVKPGTVLSAK